MAQTPFVMCLKLSETQSFSLWIYQFKKVNINWISWFFLFLNSYFCSFPTHLMNVNKWKQIFCLATFVWTVLISFFNLTQKNQEIKVSNPKSLDLSHWLWNMDHHGGPPFEAKLYILIQKKKRSPHVIPMDRYDPQSKNCTCVW